MRIMIQLSHPAQFHLFKNVAKNLIAHGHEVFILIKTKDILEDLLKHAELPYYNILKEAHRKSKLGMFRDMLTRDWRIFRFARKHKIDLFVGTPLESAQVGWLIRKPRINVNEDDMAIVPLYRKLGGPFFETLLAPIACDNGSLEAKTIKYAGYQKLAYLHPNQFKADRSVVEKYFPSDKPYFLLRFAQLKAHHDLGSNEQGINTVIARRLIDMLSPHGDVYITSERELEPQFEKYRLHINPLDIHHVLAFSQMYIGDSQSMAVEAAILGIPGIRFNDFAGRIGVLEELEHTYKLTIGIPCSEPERLFQTVQQLLDTPQLQETFQARRNRMLSDKIDVTAFFTWFIENYPASREKMRMNPQFQYTFTK